MHEFAARLRFAAHFVILSCELHVADQLRPLRLIEISGPAPGKRRPKTRASRYAIPRAAPTPISHSGGRCSHV
ncbi:hypothetical protein SHKM778_32260 [Streptomyces sp. KM77-8]|uniref:Uncharacterized protein n=1 Tax=Streptomyces haneummycinicus TaxID=3074435 RepID=A0AAT9HH78_9ACTN